MMFVWLVIFRVEHWENCERCEWLNIVLLMMEYLLKRNDISNCFTMSIMAK